MEKVFSKVILVDDDDVSNYLTGKIINKMDIAEEVVILKNGMQALEFFKQECDVEDTANTRSDLVLLDINMAVLNGFELMEALRHTNFLEKLKIVILSSSSDPNDINEAAQYRIYGYLTKPLDASKLQQIIDVISNKQTAVA